MGKVFYRPFWIAAAVLLWNVSQASVQTGVAAETKVTMTDANKIVQGIIATLSCGPIAK